jgi:hypothetical protein
VHRSLSLELLHATLRQARPRCQRASPIALNAYPRRGEAVSLAEFVIERPAGLRKVIEFMNGWAREMPRLPQLLVVRYEDMRACPEATLAEILAFIGTPGTEAEIGEAVAFASFENMRRMEAKRTFRSSGGRMLPGTRTIRSRSRSAVARSAATATISAPSKSPRSRRVSAICRRCSAMRPLQIPPMRRVLERGASQVR